MLACTAEAVNETQKYLLSFIPKPINLNLIFHQKQIKNMYGLSTKREDWRNRIGLIKWFTRHWKLCKDYFEKVKKNPENFIGINISEEDFEEHAELEDPKQKAHDEIVEKKPNKQTENGKNEGQEDFVEDIFHSYDKTDIEEFFNSCCQIDSMQV